MNPVTFDADEHKYSSNGKEYPSVTKILQHFGLIDFSFVNADVLDRACSFGSAVHKVCELYETGRLQNTNYDPKTSPVEPYLNGYKRFLKAYNPIWASIEEPMISKVWGFAGTSDRFGLIKRNAVIDFKSGASAPSHAIQTAGYEVLIEENLKEKVKERFTLLLMPNDFRLKPHKNKSDKTIFLGLAQAYNYKMKHKLIKE